MATLSEFGIRLPGDLVILSRALVTLDGTLRIISPRISLVEAATAQMAKGDEAPILDRDEMVRPSWPRCSPTCGASPTAIDRMLMLAGRGDLRIRTIVDEDSRRIVRTLVNRSLLAIVGAVFLVVSAIMLVATDAGPPVASQVGLFEVLGYGGLLAGSVLCLRVVAGVARDGTV